MKKNSKKGFCIFHTLFCKLNNKIFKPKNNNNACVHASPFSLPGIKVILVDIKTGYEYIGYFSNGISSLGVGRESELSVGNDICMARAHFELIWRSGVMYVDDLNSMGGTKVNGNCIRSMVALSQNDVISAGKSDFRVNWQPNN